MKEKMKEKHKLAKAKENIVSTRGRTFQGLVIKKFPKRITIEFERIVKIPKYERFMKKKTKIHARLPDELTNEIHVGDLVQIQECRPLSKIIHFIVTKKIKLGKEEK